MIPVTQTPSFFILAGNEDNCSVFDAFDIRPDLTMDYGDSYPCLPEKSFTDLRTIQNIFMTCWLSGERMVALCATCLQSYARTTDFQK